MVCLQPFVQRRRQRIAQIGAAHADAIQRRRARVVERAQHRRDVAQRRVLARRSSIGSDALPSNPVISKSSATSSTLPRCRLPWWRIFRPATGPLHSSRMRSEQALACCEQILRGARVPTRRAPACARAAHARRLRRRNELRCTSATDPRSSAARSRTPDRRDRRPPARSASRRCAVPACASASVNSACGDRRRGVLRRTSWSRSAPGD